MWTTRKGIEVSVDKLKDQYIINMLQLIRRRAEIRRLALVSLYADFPNDVDINEDELLNKTWRDFIDNPGFQELELEAVSRGLNWDYDSLEIPEDLKEQISLLNRGQLESNIVGALKDCINAHGPIDRNSAHSAAKRIIGVIKVFNRNQIRRKNLFAFARKW